jgi:uncharacterized protein (TIGR00725 family)
VAKQIAVCGPRACTEQEAAAARAVGRLLAEAGAVVICGGGTGVMAAVAAGARAAGGLVVGIRPDDDPATASPDLSVTILTGMGEARNAIIAASAAAMIAVGGSWGTLSEIALAKHRGIPVIALGGWQVPAVQRATSPDDAVVRALAG